ncbi:MAG: GIY-YIG nuclease family protein [Parvibaculaceae bacterium]
MDGGAWVYLLRCCDESYYVGLTRNDTPERRLSQHQEGADPKAFTYSRRPVSLPWSQYFTRLTDAIAAERQLKGWSRAKKGALIRGDFDALALLSKRPSARRRHLALRGFPEPKARVAPQDEDR